MFRKGIALTLAAVMAAAIPFTSQAGVLPSMADMTTAIQAEKAQNGAIDFGKRMNREASTVYQNADGSTAMVYTGVTNEDYEAFSTILGDAGYELTSYEMLEAKDGYRMFLHSAESGLDITMEYIGAGSSAGKLSMIYPAGVAVEQEIAQQDPFVGYIEVTKGSKIEVSGGTLEIVDVGGYFPESGQWIGYEQLTQYKGWSSLYTPHDTLTYNPWISAKVTNRKTVSMDCSTLMYDIYFYYINTDNMYRYGMTSCYGFKSNGYLDNIAPTSSAYKESGKTGTIYYGGKMDFTDSTCSISSMTTGKIGAYVKGTGTIPPLVKEATDGILAITFKVNDVDYVYYIRR